MFGKIIAALELLIDILTLGASYKYRQSLQKKAEEEAHAKAKKDEQTKK